MKEIDELIALQPQNLAAELGSAVIEDELLEDELLVLPEHEEIQQNSGEQNTAFDAEHESPEGNELS
jgi:hypothetical protein